jgi:hypothetical protein
MQKITRRFWNVAIYPLRSLRGDTLEKIGREFNISQFSSVNSVAEKMRGEDIRESTIEEVCRANQNRLIDESSVDLTRL